MKYQDRFEWEITHHPEDQEFVGRKFRSTDVRYGDWPEGTVFTNVNTGEALVWKNKQAVALQQNTTNHGEKSS
jgi:hypothetical protein